MPLVALLLGVIAGSFINALAFRFNTGKGMGGRSRCMHCGHTLNGWDLVPIFSFILLRGRCRYCGVRLSYQYPLVEAAAGLLAVLVFLTHWPDPWASGYWLAVWMTLLFIVVYDLRHMVIPWSASVFLMALALSPLILNPETSLSAILSGPLLAAPLFFISLVSRGRWMGWGDSGLALSLGWLLGPTAGLTALILAFWIGAAVGIALMLLKRRYTMKSEVPFAPFLACGACVAYFFHVDFFAASSLLF